MYRSLHNQIEGISLLSPIDFKTPTILLKQSVLFKSYKLYRTNLGFNSTLSCMMRNFNQMYCWWCIILFDKEGSWSIWFIKLILNFFNDNIDFLYIYNLFIVFILYIQRVAHRNVPEVITTRKRFTRGKCFSGRYYEYKTIGWCNGHKLHKCPVSIIKVQVPSI